MDNTVPANDHIYEWARESANKVIAGSAVLYSPKPEQPDTVEDTMSDAPTRQEVDAKLDTLRADVRADGASLRADFEALRGDVKAEFASVRGEMRSEFASVRGEMRAEFSAVRAEMHEGFASQIKWIVGTAIGLGAVGITVMTFVLNNAIPKPQVAQTQPAAVIYVPLPPAPVAQTPAPSTK